MLYRGVLVAAIELKSQVGRFGNDFNSRTEEVMATPPAIWRPRGGVPRPYRPWVGFIMVLGKSKGSTTPLGDSGALLATNPIFHNTGHLDRYRILMQGLVREKQYDAAVVAATAKGDGTSDEPVFDLPFANFRGRLRCSNRLHQGVARRGIP